MLNLEAIGQKITHRRKELNISQKELAERLFVTHQAVSKWENGKSIPSIELLYDLTVILDISIDDLLKDAEEANYSQLSKQSSIDHLFYTFLQSDSPEKDIEDVFYLLDKQHRKLILDKMISGTLDLEVEYIWHLLSKKERFYLLGVITTNKLDYDLNKIKRQLSPTELSIVKNQIRNGEYSYYIK